MDKFKNGFILTMQYNEHDFLPIWVRHYGKYFDHCNMYVIDHGSEINIVPNSLNRIFVPRSENFNETARRDCVQGIVYSLMQYHSFGIYCDTDELIVLDEFNPAAMEKNEIYYSYGFDLFNLKIGQNARIIGILNEGISKPLVFNYPIPQWSPGFHGCILQKPPVIKFILGHIKYIKKEYFANSLQNRKRVYNTMSPEDKFRGIARHWNTDESSFDEMYSRVESAISQGLVHEELPDLFKTLIINSSNFAYFEHGQIPYLMDFTTTFPDLLE